MTKNTKEKILVTGSSGFIGRYVVKEAKKRGYEVQGYDIKEGQDILNMDQVEEAIQGCNSVIHLAAIVVHQKQFEKGLYKNYRTNVEGFLNVIEAARREGIKRFNYASSSAVYGRFGHINGTFKETDKIAYIDEINHYGKSKMANEMLADSYHNAFGMDCIGTRIMNAYGESELMKGDAGCVIAHLIKDKMDGKTLEIFDDGKQAKDFIHILDTAKMIMDLFEKAPNGVYNVGTGRATNFNDLASIVGGPKKYAVNPYTYYPRLTRADMWKTYSVIGERPLTSIKDGIRKTLKYYVRRAKAR